MKNRAMILSKRKCIKIPVMSIITREGSNAPMTREALQRLQTAAFSNVTPDKLTDLRDITIDKTKTVHERITDFMNDIGNPYLFRVGDVVVRTRYNPDGKSFQDAVSDILAS